MTKFYRLDFCILFIKCHWFERVHSNSTEDAPRTVVMQAGINGFGFVLRNSLGNSRCDF